MGARTFITSPDPKFPAGTNVSVYRRNQLPAVPQMPSGPAPGGAVFGPVAVGADGRATFTGLDDLTDYLIYAATPDRWAAFRTGMAENDAVAAAVNTISGETSPADRNLLAWTFDPAAAKDSTGPVSGRIEGARIKHPGGLITGILFVSLSPLLGGVAGQNFAGIYDSNGNRLAQTADMTANWAAGSGVILSPFTAPIFLTAQQLDLVVLSNMNAGITPGIARVNGATLVPGMSGPGAPFRAFTADAAVTALPAVLGAKTQMSNLYCFALY